MGRPGKERDLLVSRATTDGDTLMGCHLYLSSISRHTHALALATAPPRTSKPLAPMRCAAIDLRRHPLDAAPREAAAIKAGWR